MVNQLIRNHGLGIFDVDVVRFDLIPLPPSRSYEDSQT